MQHAPRLFSDKGKFLPLADVLVAKLESADPSKFARYVALRDAALKNQEAEARAIELRDLEREKMKELRAAIKARNEAHPKKTFLDCWREAKNSRGWGAQPSRSDTEPNLAEAALLKDHDEKQRRIEDELFAIRAEHLKMNALIKQTRAAFASAWREFLAAWPTLSDAENRRLHLEGQQAARRGAGRTPLGDSVATQNFIQKNIRVGMRKGALPAAFQGAMRDPETGRLYLPDKFQPKA